MVKTAFADFETTSIHHSTNHAHVAVWGLYYQRKFYYDVNLRKFFDLIIDKRIKSVYFHNLTFDGSFIFKWLLKYGYKYQKRPRNSKRFILLNNHWSWNNIRGNIYNLIVKIDNFTIRFKCSYKLTMLSVKQLGQWLNFPKGEVDYTSIVNYKNKADVPKALIKYLKRDIKIVIKTFSEINKIMDGKIKGTRAATSYNDLKYVYELNKFATDFGGKIYDYTTKSFEYNQILSTEDWDYIQRSYQGGLVLWKPNVLDKTIIGKIYSYDINSLYPYVMESYKLPYGPMLWNKPLKGDYKTLICVHVISAKIKKPNYPPLFKDLTISNQFGFKYLSELEHREYVMWEDEFNLIKKYYYITYEIIQRNYFKVKYIFKEWVNRWKDLKVHATNELERAFCKGMINSAYGKFGQNYSQACRDIIYDPIKIKNGIKYVNEYVYDGYQVIPTNDFHMMRSNMARYGKNDEYTHFDMFEQVDDFQYNPVASAIASIARTILIKAVHANLKNFIYGDTDNMYLTSKLSNRIVHPSIFGAWKLQYVAKIFKVLRAKCYIFKCIEEYSYKNDKIIVDKTPKIIRRISGLSQNKSMINFDNFTYGLVIPNGKKAMLNVKGGVLLVNVDVTINKHENLNIRSW